MPIRDMRSHLGMNWQTPRIQQVPMLLEELREMHGLPGMVKTIEKVLPQVRSRLQAAPFNVAGEERDTKLARKQLERLNVDPDPVKYFRVFVTVATSRSAVQREILTLGRGLNVPRAELQHDNLLACVQHLFDSDNSLSFDSDHGRAEAETWVAWEHFHLGKMQSQAMEFYRKKGSPVPIPKGKDPVKETERLYRVLDGALGEERSYLSGDGTGKYSIADIAVFSWVNVAFYSGVNLERFANVRRWWMRILERPAIQFALKRTKIRAKYNATYLHAMQHFDLFRQQEEALKDDMREAVRQANKLARPQSATTRYARE